MVATEVNFNTINFSKLSLDFVSKKSKKPILVIFQKLEKKKGGWGLIN